MLAGKKESARKSHQRQQWSPELRSIGRTYSYYKQKSAMCSKKLIHWSHLDSLRKFTAISNADHSITDHKYIHQQLRINRAKWKACKKRNSDIRKKILSERVEMMAIKLCTTLEKVIRAIINSEESRCIFQIIRDLIGKSQKPLTQVDVRQDPTDDQSPIITLNQKEDVEKAILHQNRQHSLQARQTLFFTDEELYDSTNPFSHRPNFDTILDGTFGEAIIQSKCLSETGKEWVRMLQKIVTEEISLVISIEDFRSYFKGKQEKMASSPSGRNIGHYKTILEDIWGGNSSIAQAIIDVAYLSLVTATPLPQWKQAVQVMIDKGKGQFVNNLWIIQSVEADSNMMLHVIWGHQLICHAQQHLALDSSQYTLPGQTCNNAVLNKILFLDLSRQTLSPAMLTDFDASAAFDRILAGLFIITCERVGLPCIAGKFMFSLLKDMNFKLIKGFGTSIE